MPKEYFRIVWNYIWNFLYCILLHCIVFYCMASYCMAYLCFVLCNVSGRVCDYNSLSLPGDWRWCSVRRWEIKLEKREDQSNGKAHSLGSKGQHTSTNSHWLFHNWWSSYFFTPNLTFFLNKHLERFKRVVFQGEWAAIHDTGKIISTLLTKPSDRCSRSRSSLIGVVA